MNVSFVPMSRRGYTSLEMLSFLKGRPWDDVARAYIHALRPSSVRVSDGMVTADSCPWRVTVIVDEQGNIRSIDQEVEVGLPEPFGCGYELDQYLKTGEHRPIPEGGLAIVNARGVRLLLHDGDK